MTGGSHGFGDVRAAMALPPKQAWGRLWELAILDKEDREWFDVVVPYVLGQIERWPEGMVERRFNPPAMLGVTTGRNMQRFWPLCDTLTWTDGVPGDALVSVWGDPVLRVKRLVLSGDYRKQTLCDLAVQTHMEVEEVRFAGSGQLELAIEFLTEVGGFARIERLSIHGGFVSRSTALALARCEGLELSALELDNCRWSDEGIHELAGPRLLARLERLRVRNRGMRPREGGDAYATLGLTREGLAGFLGGGAPRVTRLGLERMDLRGGAGRLGEVLGPRLVELSLRSSKVRVEDLEEMSSSGMLDGVEALDLRSTGLFRELDALIRLELPALERLKLWHARPADVGSAEAFARSGVWGEAVRDGLSRDLSEGSFRW